MKEQTVAIIGNPNSGKTTLFNHLTGSRQKVGNWPGVTVDWKAGEFTTPRHRVHLVDLPGVYHITALDGNAVDEQIALDYLNTHQAQAVINTVDATNLERGLYLTLQLREMGLPIVLALSMTDIAQKRGTHIDPTQLAHCLQCPVIDIAEHNSSRIKQLQKGLDQQLQQPSPQPWQQHLPIALQKAFTEPSFTQSQMTTFEGLHFLESEQLPQWITDTQGQHMLQQWLQHVTTQCKDDPDILIADARYQQINQWTQSVIQRAHQSKRTVTDWLDKLVLNRVLGIPIFLGVMYAMFFIAINVGAAFQDCFDIASHALLVQAPHQWLSPWLPHWLVVLLADGVGTGLNTTLTFIPVIGLMFLCLAFLESSGYMARASFVVDRFMQSLGLPGRAFVPMIVGFGCNVPAVMATRTLQSYKDRILTILMTPFMSCGARLAIYAVFTSAFFAHNGANVVFALYLIGIAMAVITGFLLRKTLLKGANSPLIEALPPYHQPRLGNLLLHAWQRLKKFLQRAGRVIVPICLLIGTLNAITLTGHTAHGNDSALARLGQAVTPVLRPMRISQDNWPATVGLVTGTLAKEVVVGTLDSLYSQQAGQTGGQADQPNIAQQLKNAFMTIPQNLAHLTRAFQHPLQASAPGQDMSQRAYGQMYQRFGGPTAAFAYLLFVLLYFPCISTIAATVRELNKGWGWFAVLWSTGLAYSTAVCFYQAVTLPMHPVYSMIWLGGCSAALGAVVLALKWQAQHHNAPWATHHSAEPAY